MNLKALSSYNKTELLPKPQPIENRSDVFGFRFAICDGLYGFVPHPNLCCCRCGRGYLYC